MKRAVLLCLLISSFLAVPAWPQTFRGGISGSVADQSGAIISSAIVKALNPATGQSYQMLSSTTGDFAFQDLPLGDYTVTVTQAGFEPISVKDVHVSGGAIYNLPVKLSVA